MPEKTPTEQIELSRRETKMTELTVKNNPRIVLVSLYNFESYAIRTIFSILKNNKCIVTTIFFKKLIPNNIVDPSDDEVKLLLSILKDKTPDIVGISVNSSSKKAACLITQKIKELFSVPVLWGGPLATICPEECLAIADMVCIGEGDETILDIADAIRNDGCMENIDNLWIRKNRHGDIIKNKIRPLLQNLDSIPIMDMGNDDKYYIDNNRIIKGDPVYNKKTYSVMASRGCPFHCTYCSNSIFKEILKEKGTFVRKRSVDNVITELIAAKKMIKNNNVLFDDEVIVTKKEWVEEFSIKYKEKINLPFTCLFHPVMVREETVALLANAGLKNVVMGIQTGSERVRKDIFERYGSNQDIRKADEIFKKYKILPYYQFILDNPFETELDIIQTIELLLSFSRPFQLQLFSLCWFPKTKLTVKALNEGIITEEQVIGMEQKTHSNWRMRIELSTQQQKFYNSLIFLTQFQFIPKFFLSSILNNRDSVKRYQFIIISMANILQKKYNIVILINTTLILLRRGEFNLLVFKTFQKILKTFK